MPMGLPTNVTFEYGTTTSYGQEVTPEQNPVTGNSITNISADISGLTLCTTYHFRVKAENSFETVYSSDKEFKCGLPPDSYDIGSNKLNLNYSNIKRIRQCKFRFICCHFSIWY